MSRALAPDAPAIGDGEVHVWRAPARASGDLGAALAPLSRDERERAARFRDLAHARRYVMARTALRRILGAYLGRDAAALSITTGTLGRAECAEAAASELRFSLSRGGDSALVAVARARDVGVDVEPVSGEPPSPTMLERCCTPAELDALRAMPAADLRAAFIALWTRKEALLKACGDGLSQEPSGVDCSACDGAWSIQPIALPGGDVAAVAARGADWRLRCWELPRDGRGSRIVDCGFSTQRPAPMSVAVLPRSTIHDLQSSPVPVS